MRSADAGQRGAMTDELDETFDMELPDETDEQKAAEADDTLAPGSMPPDDDEPADGSP